MVRIVVGIEEDEHLWCVPPSTWQTRVFEIVRGLLGNEVESEDFKAAFLQALLRGPPVFARIPDEFETEQGKAIRAKGGVPVHRVRQAIYGLKRAGQDWQYHASSKFEARGFQSLRHLCDGSPSQFVRPIQNGSNKDWKNAKRIGESDVPAPLKVTVSYQRAEQPVVNATIEINDGTEPASQVLGDDVNDLSTRLQDVSLTEPKGTPKVVSKDMPKVLPKTPAPDRACKVIVWDRKMRVRRNCSKPVRTEEGLCRLHHNLKYGKIGDDIASVSDAESNGVSEF